MSGTIAPIERAEFVARVKRLQDEMRARAVTLMLLDDIEILAYYTGYERSISFYRACLIPLEGAPVMVLRSLDTAPFLEASWVANPIAYADTEDAVGALANVVQKLGYADAAIGLDYGSHGMTVDVFKRLSDALPHARFVAMTGVPWEQRLIKSPAEIAHIARAAAIADQTLAEITERARPGVSGRSCRPHHLRQRLGFFARSSARYAARAGRHPAP
jgi:Xaa-Pro aminopeptidase